jgi:DNA-binding CsgD family transcriptional regulator/PAS domain-containing protein
MRKSSALSKPESLALRLAGRLFDVMLRPGGWPAFLDETAFALEAPAYEMLHYNRQDAALTRAPVFNSDPGLMADYRKEYHRINPAKPFLAAMDNVCDASQLHVPDSELEHSEFYQAFMRPQELHYSMFWIHALNEREAVMMSMLRSRRQGPHSKETIALGQMLNPFIRSALRFSEKVGTVSAERSALAEVLEQSSCGVILFDEGERPVFFNRRAEELLHGVPALPWSSKGALPADSARNRALERLIHDSVQCGRGRSLHAGGSMRLWWNGASGRMQALGMKVLPLPDERYNFRIGAPRICAAVLVFPPDAISAPTPPEILCELFGLTRSEAKLAGRLAAGESLAEAARRSGISYFTARAHLRACLEKTGTHRQAELMKVILTGSGGIRR